MIYVAMSLLFTYSLVLNSVAPLLNYFRSYFELSVASSSLIPVFLLSGTVLSNIFVGFIFNKLGLRRTLLVGLFLLVTGTSSAAFSNSIALLILGMILIGFSNGFGFTGATMLLLTEGTKSSNFGLFHGAYGLGGIAAPLLIELFNQLGTGFKGLYLTYTFLAVSLTLMVGKATANALPIEETSVNNAERKEKLKLTGESRKVFITYLIMLIFYSSAEIGTITWAGTYSKPGVVPTTLGYTVFWFLFTVTRFALPIIEKTFRNIVLLNGTLLIIFLLLFAKTGNITLFFTTGAFFGPLFPYIQSRAIRKISEELRPVFNGLTYSLTSLGGNLTVFLMGTLIEKFGILSYMLPTSLILTLVLSHFLAIK
ncbi:MFS transporter [Fervidobacterium thailandense]|uniref:MFS transporter n=1 Tax=Fervidobacterium thailandense TaxID=1008305 RepID=UPI00130193A4|nr:MFS transporter [Fervidobacterium thailandense]